MCAIVSPPPPHILVEIRPETFIKMPTTFTPNGDGINDIIYVEGWGIKESLMEYQILQSLGRNGI
jgi:hypothetical protein